MEMIQSEVAGLFYAKVFQVKPTLVLLLTTLTVYVLAKVKNENRGRKGLRRNKRRGTI